MSLSSNDPIVKMSLSSTDPIVPNGEHCRQAAIIGDTSLLIHLLDNGAPFIVDSVSKMFIIN